MSGSLVTSNFPIRDYDLEATLTSGQAFRWQFVGGSWFGIIGSHWVRLTASPGRIEAAALGPFSDWDWLTQYLQLGLELDPVLASFPADEPMQAAVAACHGLRLLRQEPWECLASFVLSSTKQIIQIRQIISLLCERFGAPLPVPSGYPPAWSFPSAHRLAQTTEAELRACKMGFRAKYLLEIARRVAEKRAELDCLGELPIESARAALLDLPGVGRKIADCVLLFAYGFLEAFPVDVWVAKALNQLYFPRRQLNLARMHQFAAAHFGPNAGFAQQYLFHYMRVKSKTPRIALVRG